MSSIKARNIAFEAIQDDYNKVIDKIYDEARKGKLEIKIDNISLTIENRLERDGFRIGWVNYPISLNTVNNIKTTIISWDQ